MSAPPPPPPHGEAPKTTAGAPPPGGGLGPGNYDIFVIPQRDKGGGFIYLPSLAPNGPSFAAGFASALVLVVLFQSMAPAFQAWWGSFQGMGNMGMTLLVIAVGVGAWAWGKSQGQGSSTNTGPSNNGYRPGPGGYGPDSGANYAGGFPNTGAPPPPPPHGNQNNEPHPNGPPPSHGAGNSGPRTSWQERSAPPPSPQESEAQPDAPPKPRPKPETHKGAWEKAREETRRREEERKAREEEERRKAETARKLREFREKEARERARREREERERREKLEQEIREKEELKQKLEHERQERERLQREKEKAEQEAKERELEQKAAKEREAKEREEARKKEAAEAAARKARVEAQLEAFRKAKKEREEAEKAKKLAEEEGAARKAKEAEEAEKNARKGSTYAFSSVGEKTSMWPNGRPPVPPQTASTPPKASAPPPRPPPSASSVPPPRAAPSTAGPSNTSRRPPQPSARTVDEEQYSYRPYDKPRHRPASSVGSESSWAPSATTTRTTPPPSMRGTYTTKDPDKIVIKAVYLFMNQFAKTPASQLVSGFGTVTDGLILRITTEGLFIDDDVRGVPQREWDVKAWTLKLVEVWCPPHCLNPNATAAASAPSNSASHSSANLFQKMANQRARTADRGATKMLTGDEADAYLTEMLRACNGCCRLGLCDTKFRDTNMPSSAGQTGEWRAKSLHVLRATVRDQEGKRYMFVLDEEEAWKVAVGVQRLRKGTQVRSLGVSGMSGPDARATLETLGWG